MALYQSLGKSYEEIMGRHKNGFYSLIKNYGTTKNLCHVILNCFDIQNEYFFCTQKYLLEHKIALAHPHTKL
jgi:hypothetical protein